MFVHLMGMIMLHVCCIAEWHSGFSGRMILQDEDNTSNREGGWIRLNTLAHYSVPDFANMALVDPTNVDQQENYGIHIIDCIIACIMWSTL